MSKFKLYTFYKADGTKLPLYGTSVENALSEAGFSTARIAEELKHCKLGMDNSLEFVNGKWQTKKKPEVKVKIDNYEFNSN
jgi:hypothetical protein